MLDTRKGTVREVRPWIEQVEGMRTGSESEDGSGMVTSVRVSEEPDDTDEDDDYDDGEDSDPGSEEDEGDEIDWEFGPSDEEDDD